MANLLFYFHSTIAQCMAALLAVTGMFAVYRLQAQENKLSRTMDAGKEFALNNPLLKDASAKMWLDYSVKDNLLHKKEELKGCRQNKSIEDAIAGIDDYVCRIDAYSDTLVKIKDGIRVPVYLCAFLLIYSIAAIAVTNLIESLYHFWFCLYLLVLSFLTLLSVVLIIRYMSISLQNDEPAYKNLPPDSGANLTEKIV